MEGVTIMQSIICEIREKLKHVFPSFLNPPATELEIQSVEKQMNLIFPEQLRALYLLHNGENENGPGLFFGLPFLTLEDMLQEWKIWADLEEEYALEGDSYSIPTNYIKERYINRNWIPISKDYGGNHIGIDNDPDVKGSCGQVINFGRDEEIKYVIAEQLSDLLEFINHTLKNKKYTIHHEEDYTYWSYGANQNIHFLDVIRSLELPVLKPIKSGNSDIVIKNWLEQLDNQWLEIIKERVNNPIDFVKIKKLYLMSENLTNIEPLTKCTEVRELILSGNHITTLEPLKNMLSLKKLYLAHTPITDLHVLTNLEHLQFLNINRTKVKDCTQLAKLPSLKELDMHETEIVEYTALSQCKSLETLSISIYNVKQLEAVSTIHTLKHLKIFEMNDFSEDDLNLLGKLTQLQSLELINSHLTGLDGLKSSQTLREIKLKDTTIEDGTFLGKITSLKALELNHSSIQNLSVVAMSESLERFTGSFSQFNILKDLFHRKIDFSTIIGEMTDEESDIWHQFLG